MSAHETDRTTTATMFTGHPRRRERPLNHQPMDPQRRAAKSRTASALRCDHLFNQAGGAAGWFDSLRHPAFYAITTCEARLCGEFCRQTVNGRSFPLLQRGVFLWYRDPIARQTVPHNGASTSTPSAPARSSRLGGRRGSDGTCARFRSAPRGSVQTGVSKNECNPSSEWLRGLDGESCTAANTFNCLGRGLGGVGNVPGAA